MLDWVSSIELVLIFAVVYAIYWYSTKDEDGTIDNPTSAEDYLNNLLKHVDTQLGPVLKTPIGYLKKEYCLKLQKEIVYYCQMAGHLRLKDERCLRRMHYENNRWKQYKQLVLSTQKMN